MGTDSGECVMNTPPLQKLTANVFEGSRRWVKVRA